MYKIGTIKLTWIDPNDYRLLSSAMYTTVEEALSNTAGKKNWLIFKLKSVSGDNYTWDLLSYGVSDKYVTGMKVNDSPVLKYGGYALMILGAYYVGSVLIKKLTK